MAPLLFNNASLFAIKTEIHDASTDFQRIHDALTKATDHLTQEIHVILSRRVIWNGDMKISDEQIAALFRFKDLSDSGIGQVPKLRANHPSRRGVTNHLSLSFFSRHLSVKAAQFVENYDRIFEHTNIHMLSVLRKSAQLKKQFPSRPEFLVSVACRFPDSKKVNCTELIWVEHLSQLIGEPF